MIFDPEALWKATVGLPAELEAAAQGYDRASQRLVNIAQKGEQFKAYLDKAQGTDWTSPAATAFRDLVELLRPVGVLIQTESVGLASDAQQIADGLRANAARARSVGSWLISIFSGGATMPQERMVELGLDHGFRRIEQALEGNGAEYISMLDEDLIIRLSKQAMSPW